MPALTSLAMGAAAAASGLGAGMAGRKRRKAEKEQRGILEGMNRDNEDNFLRDYYQDAFEDPSSRSYLKRISGDLYDRNKGIENSGIATGATHENVQAQKQSANEVMSDAVNNVVVNHEAKKAGAKEQYIRRKDAIASGKMELAGRSGDMQSQNWANLGSNLAGSITGLSSAYLQGGGKLFGGNKNAAGNLGFGGGKGLNVAPYTMTDHVKRTLTAN